MMMLLMMTIALLLGYGVTVGCSLTAAFGITATAPGFVSKDHRLRGRYKWVSALMWLVCTIAGALTSAVVARVGRINEWVIGAALAALLIGMLWFNSWEARQRGIAHQILISLTTLVGVVAGVWLADRLLALT